MGREEGRKEGCGGSETKGLQRFLGGGGAAFASQVRVATVIAFARCRRGLAKTCGGQRFYRPRSLAARRGGAAAPVSRHSDVVVGCGRPAPGGFPVPFWLMCDCFRLQEEMLQREEAESTLQSFRQVCRFCSRLQPPDPARSTRSNSRSYLPHV